MDEGKEVGSEFIEAGGDSSGLLKLEEELLSEMTFFVEPPIEVPRVGVIRLERDTKICVVVSDKLT